MLFPVEVLFDNVLLDLAVEIDANPTPPAAPLPCNRWIARSALQKAIRRGETALAQRAAANLFEYDARATWRALAIIALEDVGVANIDILVRVVAAQRDRAWRRSVGGDWKVIADLVRQMAESNHCQAACDLLLRAINDPSLQPTRDLALEAGMDDLAAWLADSETPPIRRGMSALAIGGGLADGQRHSDAAAVFDVMADIGSFSHIVATCRSAWRLTRNPMALLLPLVWQAWSMEGGVGNLVDDPMPLVQLTSHVPGYALDQFTRAGNIVSRSLLADAPDLRRLLDQSGIPKGAQARMVGDLIFLWEGGTLRRRLVWTDSDSHRLPHRWLPAVPRLGPNLGHALRLVDAKASQIAKLRQGHLSIV